MNIAFDAKRYFHNHRGLGNYSRDTVRLLSLYFPENNYFLFNPSAKHNIKFTLADNTTEVLPNSPLGKTFPALWRSMGMCRQIASSGVDMYHGLSQELPIGIQKTGAKSVVTMHDAIFMRYPELYSWSYRAIFTQKNKYACKVADSIIAISEQTKRDIITFFGADEKKISVVYQGCNNIFRQQATEEQKQLVRTKYNLPTHYLLFVGAIEPRKNIATILQALANEKMDVSLVLVGRKTTYLNELLKLTNRLKLTHKIHFLHEVETADLPPIYQLAALFVYPSIFEGFGIPILEALCSATPVVTSTGSCFEEAGGKFSLYVQLKNTDEMGAAIKKVLTDTDLQETMKSQGLAFSEKFTDQQVVQNVMTVYQSL